MGVSMVWDLAHFMLNLVLAGFILRYLQVKTHGSEFGKALAYIY